MNGKENPKASKKPTYLKVDVTTLPKSGEFPCPKCGTIISPDDESETVYTIGRTHVKGDNLESLDLSCNKCGSTINLYGFQKKPEEK
jgi:predicted RNA-binding Zn-ribbon protein involved in translation (DUF1610 family)